jgi:hypothetical protein
MFLDFTQGWRVVQVFCGSQDHVRVVLKNTQRGVASFAQHPPNVIRIVTVVYGKLVLLKLERVVTNSAIIPLKFQQEVII